MTFMRKAQIILLAVVISGANVLVAEEGELDPTRQAREALSLSFSNTGHRIF